MGCKSSLIQDLILQLPDMVSKDCQMPLMQHQTAVGLFNISHDDILLCIIEAAVKL